MHEHPLTHRSKVARYDSRFEARILLHRLRKTPNWREKIALKAFDEHELLRLTDLPGNVGRRTMERLVARGLVEPADSEIGRYSNAFAWTRVRD